VRGRDRVVDQVLVDCVPGEVMDGGGVSSGQALIEWFRMR